MEDVNNIFGLEGLTQKDYEDWEKEYANEIKGWTPAQKQKAFRSKKYFAKHGYDNMDAYMNMSDDEQVAAFNAAPIDKSVFGEIDSTNKGKNENHTDIIDSAINSGIEDFNFSSDPIIRKRQMEIFSQDLGANDEIFTQEMKDYLIKRWGGYYEERMKNKTDEEKVAIYKEQVEKDRAYETSTFGKIATWFEELLPKGTVSGTSTPYVMDTKVLSEKVSDATTRTIEHDKALQEKQNTIQSLKDAISAQYAEQDEEVLNKDVADIKDLANYSASFYKKYKDTIFKDFSDTDWQDALYEYRAVYKQTYDDLSKDSSRSQDEILSEAQSAATIALQNYFSKKAYQDVPWYNFYGNAAGNLSTSLYSGIISTIGVLLNTFTSPIYTLFEDVPEGTGYLNQVFNNIFDNSITRFADRVQTSGNWLGDMTNYERTGVSAWANPDDVDDYSITNFFSHVIPEAIGQGGYTVASMVSGAALEKAVSSTFKYGTKAIATYRKIDAIEDIVQRQKAMRTLIEQSRKAERFVDSFIIPGIVGTGEGAIEGLQTKREVLEEGDRQLEEYFSPYINEQLSLIKNSGNVEAVLEHLGVDLNSITSQRQLDKILTEYIKDTLPNMSDEDKAVYKDIQNQIEWAASTAGSQDFLLNSTINGIINATFKAGLESDKVQEALKNSKFWAPIKKFGEKLGISEGRNISSITENAGKYEVFANKLGWKTKAFEIIKEPIGEGFEEYEQTLSNAFASGFGKDNIATFIANKYGGDQVNGDIRVGYWLMGNLNAALHETGKAAISEEAGKAAFYGALGSIIGTPTLSINNTKQRYVRDTNGNIILDSHGNPKMTWGWEKRNEESTGQFAGRVASNVVSTFYRSGLSQGVKQINLLNKDREDRAKTITEWLNTPGNLEKFKGTMASLNWMEMLNNEAIANDTKGYRDAYLGKTINDALMLQELEGTEFYNAHMKQINDLANIEQLSAQEKESYLVDLRSQTEFRNKSDEEIMQILKNNAQNMLGKLDEIRQIKQQIEEYTGELEYDAMTSLIYGRMALNDWEERKSQLNQELQEIFEGIKDSTGSTTLSQEGLKAYIKFGTAENVRKKIKEVQDKIAKEEAELQSLREVKDTDNERAQNNASKRTLLKKNKKYYETQLEGLQKVLTKYFEKDNEDISYTLNEHDILRLSAQERAALFEKANREKYSYIQQQILNRIEQFGMQKDLRFIEKIQDAAEIEGSIQKTLTEYNKIIADPSFVNRYVQRAKIEARNYYREKQYKAIAAIQNYDEFVSNLENLYKQPEGSVNLSSLEVILRSDNPDFYNKYITGKQNKIELMRIAATDESFKNTSNNDKDLLVAALDYLNSKGVDINNTKAVDEALQETDEEGKSKLKSYISKVNSSLLEDDKMKFTSIQSIWSDIKQALNIQKENKQAEAEITQYIEDSTQPTQKDYSEIIARAKANIQAAQAAKAAQIAAQEALGGTPKVIQTQDQTPTNETLTGNTIIDAFIQNIKDNDIIKAVTYYVNRLSALKDKYSSEVINIAEETLISLSKETYENSQDFLTSVLSKKNELLGASETDEAPQAQAASLLGSIYDAYSINLRREQRAEEAKMEANRMHASSRFLESLSLEAKTQYSRDMREVIEHRAPGPKWLNNNPDLLRHQANLPTMTTMYFPGIQEWLQKNPKFRDYYSKYNIQQYLLNTPMQELMSKEVFFYSPIELSGDQRPTYIQELDAPLVPLIQDDKGQVIINGVHYQPIGLMPTSYDDQHIDGRFWAGNNPTTGVGISSGMTASRFIRQQIHSNALGTLITSADGSPIKSRITRVQQGKPISGTAKMQAVSSIGVELDPTTRTLSKQDKRSTSIYKELKNKFLAAFIAEKHSVPGMKVKAEDVYGKNIGSGYTSVKLAYPGATQGRNSDKTLSEVLQEFMNNSDSYTQIFDTTVPNNEGGFNRRIQAIGRSMQEFFSKHFKLDQLVRQENESDEEYYARVQPELDRLTDLLVNGDNTIKGSFNAKDKLYIKSDLYSFRIVPTNQTFGSRPAFSLQLIDKKTQTITELGLVTQGKMSDQKAASIIANLFMNGGQMRTGITWQIQNSELQAFDPQLQATGKVSPSVKKIATNYISEAYDDGILIVEAPTIFTTVDQLGLQAPFTTQGKAVDTTFVSSGNIHNANEFATQAGTIITGQSEIILPETGTMIQEQPSKILTETSRAAQAKAIGEFIQQESEDWELDVDSRAYINKKDPNKARYARVTSVHPADKTAARSSRIPTMEHPYIVHSDTFQEGVWSEERGLKNIKPKFDALKELYGLDEQNPYKDLADLVFDTCAKLGINVIVDKSNELDNSTAAVFKLETSTIILNPNIQSIVEAHGSTIGQVALHESIHALTSYAIANKALLTKKGQDAVTTIEACYQRLLEKYPQNSYLQDVNLYGTKNPKEMIAELANPKFRSILKTMSLFDKVVNAISQILDSLFNSSFADRYSNLENNLLKSLHTLIDSFDGEAYTRTSKEKAGLKYLQDKVPSLQVRKETLEAFNIAHGNSTEIELPFLGYDANGIENYFNKRGYKVGDYIKIDYSTARNPKTTFDIVRLIGVENGKAKFEFVNISDYAVKIVEEGYTTYEDRVDSYRYNEWTIPSTNIGTGVDEFIRDFFTEIEGLTSVSQKTFDEVFDKLMNKQPRPNATREAWRKLFDDMLNFKYTYCQNKNLHILPRDVVAHGQVEITHGNRKGILKVAGTVDLLLYDDEGNFYVFDMKTTRKESKTPFSSKVPKYSRQVSFYQKLITEFLASQGKTINFKGLGLIPIEVTYAYPNKEVQYKQGDGNQLLVTTPGGNDYTEYRDVTMNLTPNFVVTEGVNYKEPDILFEYLPEEYKSMVEWQDGQAAPAATKYATNSEIMGLRQEKDSSNISKVEEEKDEKNTEHTINNDNQDKATQQNSQIPLSTSQPAVPIYPSATRLGGALNATEIEDEDDEMRYYISKEASDIIGNSILSHTYMLAPNGKQTNLSESLWIKVRTKAFKDKYGDWEKGKSNLLLDENGEPKVVFATEYDSQYAESSTKLYTDSRTKAEQDIRSLQYTSKAIASAISRKFGITMQIIEGFASKEGIETTIKDLEAEIIRLKSQKKIDPSYIVEQEKLLETLKTAQNFRGLYDEITQGLLEDLNIYVETGEMSKELQEIIKEYPLQMSAQFVEASKTRTGYVRNLSKGNKVYSISKRELDSKVVTIGMPLEAPEFNTSNMNITTSLAYLRQQNSVGYEVARRFNEAHHNDTAWDNLPDEVKEAYLHCGN